MERVNARHAFAIATMAVATAQQVAMCLFGQVRLPTLANHGQTRPGFLPGLRVRDRGTAGCDGRVKRVHVKKAILPFAIAEALDHGKHP